VIGVELICQKKKKNKVVITFKKQFSIMDEIVELDLCSHCEDKLRLFLSMTRNGGRGKHADLLIIDEFQDGEKKEC
jgi:hypothetical protein